MNPNTCDSVLIVISTVASFCIEFRVPICCVTSPWGNMLNIQVNDCIQSQQYQKLGVCHLSVSAQVGPTCKTQQRGKLLRVNLLTWRDKCTSLSPFCACFNQPGSSGYVGAKRGLHLRYNLGEQFSRDP